jgi:hypothetical protein
MTQEFFSEPIKIKASALPTGHNFMIRARGRVTVGSEPTEFQIRLYAGNVPLFPTSELQGRVLQPNERVTWELRARLDRVERKLAGTVEGFIGDAIGATFAGFSTGFQTSGDLVASPDDEIEFRIAFMFRESHPANVVFCESFTLDLEQLKVLS